MIGLAIPDELVWLWLGLASLAAGVASAFADAVEGGRGRERRVIWLTLAALGFLAIGIVVRWQRVGHGPFLSLFEILLSNLFSLGTVYVLAYWRMHAVRATAVVVLPVLLVLGLWALNANPADNRLPPTYGTRWLWAHVLMGKVFLGACLVAVGLVGAVLLRSWSRTAVWFRGLPGDETLVELALRFMALAFVFHSLMLIAGAVWAQDAWGRYWAWDPLETWAFLTWLAMAGAVHARAAFAVRPVHTALMILGIFVLAFLTFFGIPFVSQAPHKGAI